MGRQHVLLLMLLALGLGWSYLLTHPTGSGTSGGTEVTLWELPLEEVRALEFREGLTEVRIELLPFEGKATGGKGGPDVWIESTHPVRGTPPQPKGKAEQADDTKKDDAQPPAEHTAFKGNPGALGTVRQFAHAKALRDLGDLDSLDAETFGLSGDTGTLEIQRAGDKPPLSLKLGRTSFGGGHRYVLDPTRGRVYLMANGDFRKLTSAHVNLMDRRLLDTNRRDLRRIEIVLGAARLVFKMDESGGLWRDSSGEDRTEWINTLIPALYRLQARQYLTEEEGRTRKAQPDPNVLELEFWEKTEGPEPAMRITLGAATPWAESSFTGRPVSVDPSLMEALRKVIREILPGA